MKPKITRPVILIAAFIVLDFFNNSFARPFRPGQYPNGAALGCAACHINPAGGGPRTPFGEDVYIIIGGSPNAVPFWGPALAAKDSDGDTYCNGQEVGDPDGDGTPISGAMVTNPGVATSKPNNSRPFITSTAITQAIMGLTYQYQITASDIDLCQKLTFSLISAPSWLTLSTNGLLSGTPPTGNPTNYTINIQVSDNGSPSQTTNHVFVLSLLASFDGWRNLNFNLPGENAVSGPFDDPDGDGIVNLLEYAFKTPPKISNSFQSLKPTFSSDRKMELSIELRDDDPKLNCVLELSTNVIFNRIDSITATISDPVLNDGFKTWRFIDILPATNTQTRFGRLKFFISP